MRDGIYLNTTAIRAFVLLLFSSMWRGSWPSVCWQRETSAVNESGWQQQVVSVQQSAHHSMLTSLIISLNEEIVISLRQTVEMSVLPVKCMHIADSLLCLPAQKGNVNNLDKPGKWGHVGAVSGRCCGLHHKNVPLLLFVIHKHDEALYFIFF